MGTPLRQRVIDIALLLFGLLAVWQIVSLVVGAAAVTAPAATLRYASAMLQTEAFWRHAAASGHTLALASVIAMLGGLILGLLLGLNRLAGDVADPLLLTMFSIPKITLYPIILLVFGLGLSARVAFGVMHGIFPVAIFALNGVRNINPIYLRAARSLSLTPADTALTVLLPAALPEIIAGLRVGFAATILGTLIGEMFASTQGLGFLLVRSLDNNEVAQTLSLALFLFVLAAVANAILLALERRLHRSAAP
jgi:NitT/TauT family transport system permease protein